MKTRIELSNAQFYEIVNEALSNKKIMPDGMKLISIEELYTAGLVTLDCADSKDW